MKHFRKIFLIVFSLVTLNLFAQIPATISGKITDEQNKAVELANIKVEGLNIGTTSDKNGNFTLKVPPNQPIKLIITFVGFETKEVQLGMFKQSQRQEVNIRLKPSNTQLKGVEVKGDQIRTSTLINLDTRPAQIIPSISGGIEDIIKTQAGVSSNNELSSQYSVRGGNFDENLVYVNGIEIYRPFLIRSGQQEGLSFVNSDMVSSIAFSAGGFDAKYGNKMSSVLDITYKKPEKFGAGFTLGLLGSTAHFENASKNKKLSCIFGFRHKTNKNLLKSLDTKGDYKPTFYDVQGLINYEISNHWEVSFLENYSNNKYELVPSNRETTFGTLNQNYQFKIYFDGQEVDKFETYFGAITSTYKSDNNLKLQFIASAFQTKESETYDIQGQYWIGELDPTNNGFDNPIEVDGIGTYLNHARNYLDAIVYSLEHKGSKLFKAQMIEWGVKFQREEIDDKINEWQMVDSSGYSLPNPPDNPGEVNINPDFELTSFLRFKTNLTSNRYSGFLQSKWLFNQKITLTAGLRFNYWDYNEEFILSPRATFSYKPDWKRDIVFRLSGGMYHQPPFYKELRDLEGNLLENVKSQKSIHIVAGADWNLKLWGRPFKLMSEIYYKKLDDLIPYKIDNVRIRYLPNLSSKGYAAGIDFKINGEFVEGVESWASLSIMKTEEDIIGDYYMQDGQRIEPGYIPRPTDQRFNFSLFFQDYLPNNPTYKVQVKLVYGSRLPFGPPNSEKYKDMLRIPPYRRVDIGFSKEIIGDKQAKKSCFKSLWLTAEVLNLFQINNTVSYVWVKDVGQNQYAVPNYLTGRQLNFKLIASF